MTPSIGLGIATLYLAIGVTSLASGLDPEHLDAADGCTPVCAQQITTWQEQDAAPAWIHAVASGLTVLVWPVATIAELTYCRCLRTAGRRAARRARAARKSSRSQ
ncbi:hypothetical protein [Nocardiopsis coralliicola]